MWTVASGDAEETPSPCEEAKTELLCGGKVTTIQSIKVFVLAPCASDKLSGANVVAEMKAQGLLGGLAQLFPQRGSK